MQRQTHKNRSAARMAAMRERKAQRAAQAAHPVQPRKQERIPASLAQHIIRHTLASDASLASLQRRASEREPGAAFTLSAFERLAERRTGARRGIVAAMRESNCSPTRVRLAWPETRDRTPDHWHRRIVAPTGWQRLEWRIVLVREGAKEAAAYAARKGSRWQYPATGADRVQPADRPTVVLATTAADRAALADGIA